ncbi:Rieske (2Fe-2S) protein [Oceaniserpentilla sp. 4NH20-0058]|uniref:Rieske (2Fe-2S) protein n=1 Tax=Oceaniserpentilla sp. 4NH20-0058 TaxID=3127660 RepID=UPI00310467D3
MPVLCHLNDISDNHSKGFTINQQLIFAVKKYGKIHIYKNSCPHLGIQLEMVPDQFLDSSDSLIMCSMHGALFRIEDGYCISGPCLDQALQSIPFTIENDQIIVDL